MALSKQVHFLVPGSPEPQRPLEITPGMTVGDAMQRLGFSPEHRTVRTAENNGVLDPSENLFHMAREGDRFSLSPKLDAGNA